MKAFVLVLFYSISLVLFAQHKNLNLYNYSYSIESFRPMVELIGSVENIRIENDTTKLTFEVIYKNSYFFDNLSLYMSGDTLIMDVIKFDWELCFCGQSLQKYLFELEFEKLETPPVNYKFIHNSKAIVDIGNNTLVKIISPVSFKQINHDFYNYKDKYGIKEGAWYIDNDSCIWTIDSLYIFDHGQIISKSPIIDQPFATSDSIIRYYENEKLINEIERVDGYTTEKHYYYYANRYEILIDDSRMNSKKYDRILTKLTYSNDGYLIERCLYYIMGKRIVKTKCR